MGLCIRKFCRAKRPVYEEDEKPHMRHHINEGYSNDDMSLINMGDAHSVSPPLCAASPVKMEIAYAVSAPLCPPSPISLGNAYAVSAPLCPPSPTKTFSTSNATYSKYTSSQDTCTIQSTDSPYDDETSEEHKGPNISKEKNVKSSKTNAPSGENYEVLSHDLESMVEIFQEQIEKTVDVTRILPHLTFISPSDEGELLQASSESRVLSMRKLIEKINALNEEGKWEAFVIALELEGYACIVQDLRGEPQEDYLENRKLVHIFASPLIKQINTYKIAQHLYMKNIISHSDKEVVERECYISGKIQGARKLLQCLHHCSSNWFEQYCDALKECGHNDLFELLSPETTEPTEQNPNEADSNLFYLTPISSEPKEADNDLHQNSSMEAFDNTQNTIKREEEKLKTEKALLESITELNNRIAGLEKQISGPSFRGQENHEGRTIDREKQNNMADAHSVSPLLCAASPINMGNAYAVSPPLCHAPPTKTFPTSHAADSKDTSSQDTCTIQSTDSAYSDETSEERKSPKFANKTNVKSFKTNAPSGENYEVLSHDLESMVEIFQGQIEETVDVTRIIPHLTFISPSDEGELLQASSESRVLSMRKLIEKINALNEEGKWEAFVIALEREGYTCIVQDLRGEPQEDYLENRKLVHIFASPLIKQMNTYEIAQHLYMKNIISHSDKEVVERECYISGKIQGARKLLQCLHHCSSKWFQQFCDILKECGHNDLFELLSPETTEPTGQIPNDADSNLFYLTPISSEPKEADNDLHQNSSMEAFDNTQNTIKREEEKLKTEKELLESITELNNRIAGLEEKISGPSIRGQENLEGRTRDSEKQVDICVEMRDLIMELRSSFSEELKAINNELAGIQSKIGLLKEQLVPSPHPKTDNDEKTSSGYSVSTYYVLGSSCFCVADPSSLDVCF